MEDEQKGTVLVVDDTPENVGVVFQHLEMAGFRVLIAQDGPNALRQAHNNRPDLILMDVRMPRMTGYDACRRLKEMESTRDIPIIFLSAKGQGQEIQTGLEVGAIDYILKPFTPTLLVERINSLLAQLGKSGPTF